jgi:hypothetical protein
MTAGGGSRLSDAQAEKWTFIRNRGRRRYILVTGVLGYGLPTALICPVVMQLTGAPGPLWGRLVIALLMFPLGGITFGRLMWSINERRYQEWSVSRRS